MPHLGRVNGEDFSKLETRRAKALLQPILQNVHVYLEGRTEIEVSTRIPFSDRAIVLPDYVQRNLNTTRDSVAEQPLPLQTESTPGLFLYLCAQACNTSFESVTTPKGPSMACNALSWTSWLPADVQSSKTTT